MSNFGELSRRYGDQMGRLELEGERRFQRPADAERSLCPAPTSANYAAHCCHPVGAAEHGHAAAALAQVLPSPQSR